MAEGLPPPPVPTTPWLASLRDLLRERLGLDVPADRARGELAAFVAARARALGLEDEAAWLDAAAEPGEGEEWRRLVAAATVGETYFFRHPEQLRAIVSFARARAAQVRRPLALWSAGCATGEEPWSLAIALAEAGLDAEVLGTDVNVHALERAREARGFRDRSVAHVPPATRDRWLAREGATWRLPRARDLRVTFAPHNLVHDAPPRSGAPGGRFDVVVCRNVLIYFPAAVVVEVVPRLLGALDAEGGLWLGPADLLPTDLLAAHRDRWDGERLLRPGSPRAAEPPRGAPVPPPAPGTPPERPAAPALGVETLLARGLVASAEEELERRVARSPDDGAAWLALAAIALARHDFVGTASHLDRAGRAHPPPCGLDYVRGLALRRAGREDEAAEAFVEALEADPDDWAAAIQLALHRQRTGRRLQEEVLLEHARRLLDQEPPRTPDHGLAAHLLDSVHGDATAARRAVRARLEALTPALPGRPS